MQEYCYYCMKPLNGASVCPHCGKPANSSETTSPYHLVPGSMLTEKYMVGAVLGEGGFGITYIGIDTTLSKRVAIKEFYPSGAANRTNTISPDVIISKGKEDFFQKGVDRFLQEAKNVAAFYDEDGIVDVYDYFQKNGTAYIVMEYLDGETLQHHVNTKGRFRSDELISKLIPVMRSLSYMHAKGIIHRDISPDNIMYTKRGKMKLMDFGSARYFTNEDRKMSVILKQGFAPFEQYSSKGEQGPYTDVYSLCATIYACITGGVPVDSLDRLGNDTLKRPSELGVAILPHHEQALMHGLAVKAENRTRDMDTLIKELTTPLPAGAQPPRSAQNFTPRPAQNFTPRPAAPQPTSYRPQQNIPPQNSYIPHQNSIPQQNSYIPPQNSYTRQQNSIPQQNSSIPQQNSYIPQQVTSKKSNKKTIMLVAIILAVLVVAGSIVGIVLGTKGCDSKGGSSSSSVDVHKLYTSEGKLISDSESIDTSDSEAEAKINKYLTDYKINDSLDSINEQLKGTGKVRFYVKGNVLVYECRFTKELSETELNGFLSGFTSSFNNVDINTMRSSCGVDNLVMAAIVIKSDDDIAYKKLFE